MTVSTVGFKFLKKEPTLTRQAIVRGLAGSFLVISILLKETLW